MQGFNKYYPPDYDDAKHGSLNSYRGKHALGDRARKIDQGILITRFELPFNIWCGSCDAHIGMGVRYNAEKKKIGMYYSTPIFSFRCKCHLCSGWFEIHTDPKNTRYVVVSGARQKMEDWDPEENGGYAVHDTNGKTEPVDPLAALEKSTDAQTNATKVQAPRIEQLQSVSEHYNADPYEHSRRVRKRFRVEKKIEKAAEALDQGIKERYGLPAELKLIRADAESEAVAKDEWEKGRVRVAQEQTSKRRKLALDAPVVAPAATGSSSKAYGSALASLRTRILANSSRSSGAASRKPTLAGIAIRKLP
ncbi:DUF572-domain-containing protein [Auriscalpium vulgare]|uniref:DUF572-domain-containing protein n=1 Tax=Auriscalpium vulgare TaxID=40419 RepID=A0ACB8RYN0_9AGAM|nr:DUF572-domain-containing protein [Auriscalpium vulgare]